MEPSPGDTLDTMQQIDKIDRELASLPDFMHSDPGSRAGDLVRRKTDLLTRLTPQPPPPVVKDRAAVLAEMAAEQQVTAARQATATELATAQQGSDRHAVLIDRLVGLADTVPPPRTDFTWEDFTAAARNNGDLPSPEAARLRATFADAGFQPMESVALASGISDVLGRSDLDALPDYVTTLTASEREAFSRAANELDNAEAARLHALGATRSQRFVEGMVRIGRRLR